MVAMYSFGSFPGAMAVLISTAPNEYTTSAEEIVEFKDRIIASMSMGSAAVSMFWIGECNIPKAGKGDGTLCWSKPSIIS